MHTSAPPKQYLNPNLNQYNNKTNTRELLSQASDPRCRQGSPKPGRIVKNNEDCNNASRSKATLPRRPFSINSSSLEEEHTRSLARPIPPRKI